MTQPIEKNGAGDGARTRDLRRDRPEGPLVVSTPCSENKAPESYTVSERPLYAEWQPIETAPKDGRPFIALNHDREVWPAKYAGEGRICFRLNGRYESTQHVKALLANGEWGWVRDDAATKEEWRSDWTLWASLYEFRPTHWMPLPSPPETPILSERVM